MDGNHSSVEGHLLSRAGSGAQPPRLSPDSAETAPASVQSALREVRPDDLDAIFDGALFGPPALETSAEVSGAGRAAATPVPVGAMEWYAERHGQPAGPYRLERLRELWHQGELSPDTLFWCEAWSTWRPLSSVPELVASLTIAGLPTVAADAAVSTAPASEKESGSGKKVVSALHSLVEEEEVWLRQMKDAKEQAKEEARSAMLDVPTAPVVAPAPVPVVQPVVATAGLLAPVPVQPVPMMAAPIAPPAPEPAQRGKGVLAGVLIGSAAVGIVAGALLLLTQNRGAPEQVAPRQEAPSVAPAAVPAPAPVVVAPAPVVQAPAPAPVAPAPVVQQAPAPVAQAPVTSAPVAQTPAPVVKAVTPAPQPATVTPVPEKPVVKAVAPAPQPEKPKPAVVAPAAPEVRVPRAVEPAPRSNPQPPPAPANPVKVKSADPLDFDDALDKKFEEELGLSPSAPKFKPEDPRGKRNVYIPPEPGKDLPETLSTSDVVQVVGSHKDAILACITTHSPARMSDSGKDRFVVRWRVLPTGDAVDALLETEGLEGTPFARCIEGQVRSWKFPQHRVQSREPVRFPFTY
ncbi:MAG TPA: GYF domain-containing protein [Archangium sp.]|uniref:GYF domain-containing protein n=1 Tax=Archangium sp. TaxID=1872627 RepID=UPI002E34549E|nr:GYF domain-containing protein [Archangium sp.]HEX5744681.1 GYF domain-containing protein [Archangium sp.]